MSSPDGTRGVVVLGMDRSGTSSVTRMFHSSGYFVGVEADLMVADAGNPTGYFENMSIYRANERVLGELGDALYGASVGADPAFSVGLRNALDRLLSIAKDRPLALKDPRIGMLISLWWPLLKGVLHPVLVVRHPLKIALSLEHRDGTAVPSSLAMWELHITRLLACLDGERVTVAPYRQALQTRSLPAALVNDASVKLHPALRRKVDPEQAPAALDPALYRNRAVELAGTHCLSAAQQRLWELLDSWASGSVMIEAPRWARQTSEASRALARHEKHRIVSLFALGAEVEQAGRELEQRDRHLAAQDQALAEQAERLAAVAAQCAALEDELAIAREQCDVTEERLRVAEGAVAAAEESRSWRATEPVRVLKRRVR